MGGGEIVPSFNAFACSAQIAHMDPRLMTSKLVLSQIHEESVEDSEEQRTEREMSGWQT